MHPRRDRDALGDRADGCRENKWVGPRRLKTERRLAVRRVGVLAGRRVGHEQVVGQRDPVDAAPLQLRRQNEDVLLDLEATADVDANAQNDLPSPKLSAIMLRAISLLIGATR